MDILSGAFGKYRKLILAGQFRERNDMNALEEYVDICIKANKARVIIDLDRLTFINSQALGLLVKLHTQCKEGGGRLILHQPTSSVQEVIAITGLSTFMTITNNEAELEQAM